MIPVMDETKPIQLSFMRIDTSVMILMAVIAQSFSYRVHCLSILIPFRKYIHIDYINEVVYIDIITALKGDDSQSQTLV